MITPSRIAIVDFGMGNLFSVQQACARAGAAAAITQDPRAVAEAGAIILPGVGAFGDAMAELERRDLAAPLLDAARRGVPMMGICLGMQLFLTESHEFGRHRGLGLVEGEVVRLDERRILPHGLKIPHVGWSRVRKARAWTDTPLGELRDGAHLYFVHSFHAIPKDCACVLATTRYGDAEFCAALARGNLFACQFHPERSGPAGLAIYRRFFQAARAGAAAEG